MVQKLHLHICQSIPLAYRHFISINPELLRKLSSFLRKTHHKIMLSLIFFYFVHFWNGDSACICPIRGKPQKAAEQGNPLAQNNLGMLYYYGQGVPKSKIKAIQWLSKAAEQGNVEAQNLLNVIIN